MESYIVPIKTAFFIFPVIAFLFTLPYMIVHYRKYGAIPALRTLVVYSMILYLITAYFLVILPLPPVEQVLQSTLPRMQIVPFQFVADIAKESSFVWSEPNTYIKALADPAIYQVLYNVILLLPFGFYLRYYFKCSWLKTVFYSFLLSLFFEVTQLTGLYGIYPRNYRLFDVDDLMMNTLGGYVGYLLTPVISIFLPSRDKLDKQSYEMGKHISYLRRFCAFCLDWLIVIFTYPILALIANKFSILKSPFGIQYATLIVFYFIVMSMLLQGQTLGKRFFKLKVVRTDQYKLGLENYIVRYGILYFFVIPAPFIFLAMLSHLSSQSFPFSIVYLGIMMAILGFFLYSILQALYGGLSGKKLLCYEKWSHTKLESTIVVPESSEKVVKTVEDEG